MDVLTFFGTDYFNFFNYYINIFYLSENVINYESVFNFNTIMNLKMTHKQFLMICKIMITSPSHFTSTNLPYDITQFFHNIILNLYTF